VLLEDKMIHIIASEKLIIENWEKEIGADVK
jgi:hypothetical protein